MIINKNLLKFIKKIKKNCSKYISKIENKNDQLKKY